MSQELSFQAAVFDLDGVITDTARLHAAAWKELIDGYLETLGGRSGEVHEPFDADRDYRRYVDGKPRSEGLRSFLEARGIELPYGDLADGPEDETVCGLANRKDGLFNRVLEEQGVELVGGIVDLVRELRDGGVKVAVASSSRNCGPILERAGISGLFEARVDGVTLQELGLTGKPHPDMFLEAVRRLQAEPAGSAVFEDAVSGVEAGRRGEFGLVVGVAVDDAVRVSLREAGADLVVGTHATDDLSVELLDRWFSGSEHRRPPVLARWGDFVRELGGRDPALFLDYDGTLTPIVSRPGEAGMSDEMRAVVAGLARRFPTTIVSGRGRDDVERLVGLENVNYAGSHGFDISGPRGPAGKLRHEAATEVEPLIDRVTGRLEGELEPIEGTVVEPKRFTVAVHYRLVAEHDLPAVEAAVDEVIEDHPELRKAHGKKVFEIRPALDWDKGRAVLWLLEALKLDGPGTVPLYVGDDTTDEDAFRALEGRGVGLVVTRAPRPTAAAYQLQDTREVRHFLERLTDL